MVSFFAATTAVLSQISIPLPFTPIPINLAIISVFIAGGFLGSYYGFLSQLIYILIGSIGIPVFAKFSGGLGILTGPTGGYLVGYLLCSFLVGLLYKKKSNIIKNYCFLIVGLFSCYFIGTIYFMFLTKNSLYASLTLCVFPFILGDLFKAFIAIIVLKKL